MKKIIMSGLIASALLSCQKETKNTIDISNIKISPKFVNFEDQFSNADTTSLQVLKRKFPYLFPQNVHDSIWLNKINNKDEQILYKMAKENFGDFSDQKEEIIDLYKRIKYFKSKFIPPKTITLISNIDYNNSIIYSDSLVLISLDMYLGKNSEVYNSFPYYLAYTYEKENIVIDIAEKASKKEFHFTKGRTFLEAIVYEAKSKYIMNLLLPNKSEQEIMGYPSEKYNWALKNEFEIWSYFIDNKMLFSTEQNLTNRFIKNAPFSKFYLNTDQDSPGRIGVWIGYQIIKSYMSSNNISLEKMLSLDALTILNNSKYKPKKRT